MSKRIGKSLYSSSIYKNEFDFYIIARNAEKLK